MQAPEILRALAALLHLAFDLGWSEAAPLWSLRDLCPEVFCCGHRPRCTTNPKPLLGPRPFFLLVTRHSPLATPPI